MIERDIRSLAEAYSRDWTRRLNEADETNELCPCRGLAGAAECEHHICTTQSHATKLFQSV